MTSTSGLPRSHGLSRQTSTTGLLDNHLTNQSKKYSRKKTASTASGPSVPMDDDCNSEIFTVDQNDSDDSMDVAFFPSWIYCPHTFVYHSLVQKMSEFKMSEFKLCSEVCNIATFKLDNSSSDSLILEYLCIWQTNLKG